VKRELETVMFKGFRPPTLWLGRFILPSYNNLYPIPKLTLRLLL